MGSIFAVPVNDEVVLRMNNCVVVAQDPTPGTRIGTGSEMRVPERIGTGP